MAKGVFYTQSSYWFMLNDGQVLPVIGIAPGTRVTMFPSRETLYYTGSEWVHDDTKDLMEEVREELKGVNEKLNVLVDLCRLVMDKL